MVKDRLDEIKRVNVVILEIISNGFYSPVWSAEE